MSFSFKLSKVGTKLQECKLNSLISYVQDKFIKHYIIIRNPILEERKETKNYYKINSQKSIGKIVV